MSKKATTTRTTKTARTPRLVPRTGNDHHALMLLSAINGNDWDGERMVRYVEAARAILQSPNAFDQGIDTLSIDRFVCGRGGLDGWTEELGDLLRAIIDEETDDKLFTEKVVDLRSMIYSVITETTLYSAAVMYELLKGGAR